MCIEIRGAQTHFVFRWPLGTEGYGPVIEVRLSDTLHRERVRLYVAYGFRKAFGAMRRRILVFRNEADVLAEFVGVDNWAEDKRVVTFLRRDRSKKYLRVGDPLPYRYSSFNVVCSESVIRGRYAPRCMAAVLDEADIPGLLGIAIAREQGEMANARELSTACEATARTGVSQQVASSDQRQAVVQALLNYRGQQRTGGAFTGDKKADEFLRENPVAFLMAASLDRGALAESVWRIPLALKEKLGHLDPRILSQMSEDELEKKLRQLDRQPRFPRQSARTIVSLAKLLATRFNGDATGIWNCQEPPSVVQTLQEIWGVGPGIAHMVVRILLDEFGYQPSPRSLQTIDVKPDTHVTRVFYRTGLTTVRSGQACVEAARELHQEFPGLLDWPAWEIGRAWCHEHKADCVNCPLRRVCLSASSLLEQR